MSLSQVASLTFTSNMILVSDVSLRLKLLLLSLVDIITIRGYTYTSFIYLAYDYFSIITL